MMVETRNQCENASIEKNIPKPNFEIPLTEYTLHSLHISHCTGRELLTSTPSIHSTPNSASASTSIRNLPISPSYSSVNDIHSIQGRVVHIRSFSKKILFLDIRLCSIIPHPTNTTTTNSTTTPTISTTSCNCQPCSEKRTSCCSKITIIAKYPFLSPSIIASYNRSTKLGDLIDARGTFQYTSFLNPPILILTSLMVIEKYNLRIPFTPEIPSRLETKSELCKFWLNEGKCRILDSGGQCGYDHDASSRGQLAKIWVDKRIADRLEKDSSPQLVSNLGSLSSSSSSSNSMTISNEEIISRSSHASRASIFVEFLLSRFSSDYLSTGTGVIDVAGGRGAVAFELQTLRGIPCTIIDPRGNEDCVNMTDNKNPLHTGEIVGKTGWKAFKKLPQEKNGLYGTFATRLPVMFNDSIPDQYPSLFRDCSIIIGMHPDSATDFIIKVAARLGKPWAIVPCCVFPTANPHRKLLNPPEIGGERPVVGYEDYIEWLKIESGLKDIVDNNVGGVDWLRFRGRSLVVWKSAVLWKSVNTTS